MKRLAESLRITDYRIRSRRITQTAIWVVVGIIVFLIIGELTVDIRSTDLRLLLPTAIASLVLALLSEVRRFVRFIPPILVTLLLVIAEAHFFVNPKVLHVIQYWLAYVVIVALLLQGPRVMLIWLVIVMGCFFMNSYYLKSVVGDSYAIEINRVPFLFIGILFCLTTLSTVLLLYNLLGKAYLDSTRKSEELLALKLEVEQNNEKLARYQKSLLTMARKEHTEPSQTEALFQSVCRTAVENLGVTGASIWQMNADGGAIMRRFNLENQVGQWDPFEAYEQDYPAYFEALRTGQVISASDARTHPMTREFAEGYLIPRNIYSTLDCPIVLDQELYGVVCCEHVGEVREWRTEDCLFVQSLADLIAISFKNDKIRHLLQRVRSQNHELIEKTNEIEAMNEELNALNEELTTINESLESTVKKRTAELESQNQQLTEYAFINSHLLRAPLARIQGLAALITAEVETPRDTQLMDSLIRSTDELDLIIRRISDVLYEGRDLTRDDIKEIINKKLQI